MKTTDHFEAIVSEYYQPLFRFALKLTHMESDARDLTQQTFYVWATKGHQLRDLSRVKTWLFTTLHRAFLVRRRREGRFIHHELQDVAEELPTVAPLRFDRGDASQVKSALAQLDPIYQDVVALFYLEERSYPDIAVRLGVPVGTVKSRVARGLVQLRRILMSDEADAAAESAGPTLEEWDESSLRVEEPRGVS